MNKTEIAYLCNQKKDCNTSLICGKECTHTLDVEHAKNFAMCFENENGCKYIETGEKDLVEVVRCKDCIYFELDHWVNVNGQPLIVAHEICAAWGGGCKTIPDGYCNMGERKEDGGICL